MTQQSPTQEAAERIGEAMPGLVLAAHVAALDNQRSMLADARKRVSDSHRWHAKGLGMPDPGEQTGEDMGAIVITGDIYGSDSERIVRALQGVHGLSEQPAANATVPSPGAPSPSAAPSARWPKALALAAALVGGSGIGAAVPWALGAYREQAVTVENVGDRQLGIEVIPGGASR